MRCVAIVDFELRRWLHTRGLSFSHLVEGKSFLLCAKPIIQVEWYCYIIRGGGLVEFLGWGYLLAPRKMLPRWRARLLVECVEINNKGVPIGGDFRRQLNGFQQRTSPYGTPPLLAKTRDKLGNGIALGLVRFYPQNVKCCDGRKNASACVLKSPIGLSNQMLIDAIKFLQNNSN